MWDDHRLLNQLAAALYTSALLAVVYGGLMLTVRLPVFALHEIRVQGDIGHTTRRQVQAIVQQELRGTFFTVDLETLRAGFEKLPWVRRANLRRSWPDRLEVAIEEHVPVARWHDFGLVNSHGEVFEAASAQPLPTFYGPDGSAVEMAMTFDMVRAALAPIGRGAAELRLSSRRAWQLKLDDGRVLELGRQDLAARLGRFVTAYPRIAGQLPADAARFDLRYPNGFAVRLPGLRRRERPA
jgi:cell division protein FtsQ